nr:type II toxin-antitoxin system VapC family toxin [Bacteroidota bacterium]
MNGTKKLLDTNILIYLSKKELSLSDIASAEDELYISVITYMESLGHVFETRTEETIITELCNNLNVIALSDGIVKKVIEIRKFKKIKLPDAIILATVLTQNLTLITRNTNDFTNINDDLMLFDPFEKR